MILEREMNMKKISILWVLILALIVTTMAWANNTSETNATDFYAYADPLDLIKIIDTQDLTLEDLENRNGKLIIERVIGIVEDAETGDGRCFNGEEYYNYISYKGTPGISNGDIICSYMIYNPDNNYEDDIIMRFDYIIDRED
jgi:hypothetical protein